VPRFTYVQQCLLLAMHGHSWHSLLGEWSRASADVFRVLLTIKFSASYRSAMNLEANLRTKRAVELFHGPL
jgi:hypothetical protein